MSALDTVGADDEVGRLADRDAAIAKPAIKPGDLDGEKVVQQRNDLIAAQQPLDPRGVQFVPGSLKN